MDIKQIIEDQKELMGQHKIITDIMENKINDLNKFTVMIRHQKQIVTQMQSRFDLLILENKRLRETIAIQVQSTQETTEGGPQTPINIHQQLDLEKIMLTFGIKGLVIMELKSGEFHMDLECKTTFAQTLEMRRNFGMSEVTLRGEIKLTSIDNKKSEMDMSLKMGQHKKIKNTKYNENSIRAQCLAQIDITDRYSIRFRKMVLIFDTARTFTTMTARVNASMTVSRENITIQFNTQTELK